MHKTTNVALDLQQKIWICKKRSCLGTASKLNRRLTAGSVRFRAVLNDTVHRTNNEVNGYALINTTGWKYHGHTREAINLEEKALKRSLTVIIIDRLPRHLSSYWFIGFDYISLSRQVLGELWKQNFVRFNRWLFSYLFILVNLFALLFLLIIFIFVKHESMKEKSLRLKKSSPFFK